MIVWDDECFSSPLCVCFIAGVGGQFESFCEEAGTGSAHHSWVPTTEFLVLYNIDNLSVCIGWTAMALRAILISPAVLVADRSNLVLALLSYSDTGCNICSCIDSCFYTCFDISVRYYFRVERSNLKAENWCPFHYGWFHPYAQQVKECQRYNSSITSATTWNIT